MSTRSMSRFVTGLAVAAILAALGASAASAGATALDDVHRSPEPGAHACASVAILPVASVNGSADAERLVEESWTEFCGGNGIRWMRAGEVRAAFAGTDTGAAELAGMHRQIWRRGEVEPGEADRLARSLGVDAVLAVRIDRWEIVDGGRAVVQMSAVLTGADGQRLWSISGLAGCGAQRASTKRHFNDDLSEIWSPRLEPRELGREKLGCALYELLARWEGALPSAPAYARHDAAGGEAPATID